MNNKTRILIATGALLTLLILTICLWWRYGGRVALLPVTCLYLLEWAARIKQHRYYAPPGWYAVRKAAKKITVKKKKSAKAEQAAYVTDIADWLVKDMLKCHAGDYSSVGNKENYQILLYQFIDAEQADNNELYKTLIKRKIEANNKLCGIAFNSDILRTRYSRSAAEYLRKSYPQFEFLPSTYLKDIEKLAPIKIKLEIDLERIDKQLAKQAESETGKEKSIEQKRNELIDTIRDINKVEGVAYSLTTITALELARGKHALQEYIKREKPATNGRQ